MTRSISTALRTAIAIAAITVTASASAANTRWNIDHVPATPTEAQGDATLNGWFEVDEFNHLTDWQLLTIDRALQPEDQFGNRYTPSTSMLDFSNASGYGTNVSHIQLVTFDSFITGSGNTLPYKRSLMDLRIDLPTAGTTGSGSMFETDWSQFSKGGNVMSHSTMFTVTAVPEPETAAMGLAGLAALGAVAARRRRAAAKADCAV